MATVKYRFALATAATVFLCIATLATADIYKYRAPDGRLIISNTPPPPAAQVEKESTETVRSDTPEPSTTTPSPPPQTVTEPHARALAYSRPTNHHKRDRAANAAAQWKRRYNAAHRQYSHLHGLDVPAMIERYREKLHQRDTEHHTNKGSNAIHQCERQYWGKRSLLACLVAHYGG